MDWYWVVVFQVNRKGLAVAGVCDPGGRNPFPTGLAEAGYRGKGGSATAAEHSAGTATLSRRPGNAPQ